MSKELKSWGLLVFLSLIWGTSFILIKKSLIAFTPVEVAILRVGLSGVGFLPFFFWVIRKLEWRRWWFYLIIAATGSGIPALLYAIGQTRLSSATTGILNSITPIFTLLVGVFLFKKASSKLQMLGTFIGFLGVSALIYLDQPINTSESIPIFFALLIVFATLMYGVNVNLIKEYFQNVPPVQLSSFAFVLLGIPVILTVPFTDIPQKVMEHPHGLESFGALCILAIFSTVLALILFYKLVQDMNAVFASTVAYIIPIVALIWGLFDGEYVGIPHLISMGVILVGIFLIRKGDPN